MTIAAKNIEFVSCHEPVLDSGDYTIDLKQTIKGEISDTFSTETQAFSVLGPRFTLEPQEIQTVFPPVGSLGEHSNVLPHVILKRSTLPWERHCDLKKDDGPWLALLLFTEEEVNGLELETLSLADLKKDKNLFPKFTKEFGDHDDDQVKVITLKWSLLEKIIPSKAELKLLSHVRQNKDENGALVGEERAVIIANRLPKAGEMSTVHLVSIEGRYQGDNFTDPLAGDKVRLVSLYSWRFACVSEKQSFKGLLMHLNHQLLFNFPSNFPSSAAITDNLNSEVVPETIIDSLNSGVVPATLKQAFSEIKPPLLEAAIVADQSQWQLTDIGRHYFASKKAIYDQAGRRLLDKLDLTDKAAALAALESMIKAEKAAEQAAEQAKIKAEPAKIKTEPAKIKTEQTHWWLQDNSKTLTFFVSQEHGYLYVYHLDSDSSSTLRLPPIENEVAESYLARGCVPLPHSMRQGNKSVSWYQGPLVPGNNQTTDNISLPIRAADELVRYNAEYGMFDVSYAAAWELGRLLTLQSKKVSVDLFSWKRSHVKKLKDAEQQLTHLPFDSPSATLDLPKNVKDWFENIRLLKGVPFSYLVADEQMLPPESIRFFQLDEQWLECFLDGAFSIGRVLAADHEHEKTINDEHEKTIKHGVETKKISGILLRSDLVAGWPHLLVDGHGADGGKLELLRQDNLSKNVLICLFEGVLESLDIHQKPEALHFGVSKPDDEHPTTYYKVFRKDDGEVDPNSGKIVLFKNKNKRVVNINDLANGFNSAQFALQMIEGVEKVRFLA